MVVAAHADVSGLAGGFIGVDVFFVLSGYLITALLVEERQRQGHIALLGFYARRLGRLLPALLVVIGISMLLARHLLMDGDQPPQALAAAAASVWLSNLYFAFSRVEYFGAGAENNLFLHTWSLGVEEQFYLVWPALLILLTRHGIHVLRRCMPLIALAGFAVGVIWTLLQPLQAFYLMPPRSWQFALGASVFLWAAPQHWQPSQIQAQTLGWAGLALLAVAVVGFDGQMTYPGAWAALPSMGAAALLIAGPHPGTPIHWLLTRPAMQRIGRYSYAWYLWHWPVILLGAAVWTLDSPAVRALLVGASLLLAIVTHHGVEAPVRQWARTGLPTRAVLAGALVLMVGVHVSALRWHNHALSQAQAAQNHYPLSVRDDMPVIYTKAHSCDELHLTSRVKVCEYGAENPGKMVFVLGDSVGLQWFPALEQAFLSRGWRLRIATKSACPIVDAPIVYSRIGRRYTECERWRTDALRFIAETKPDLLLIGSHFTYEFSETEWREGTRRVLEVVAPAVADIRMIRATPMLPFDAPSCLAAQGTLPSWLASGQRCSAPATSKLRDDVHAWQQSGTQLYPQVRWLDMTEAVCPSGICSAQQGDLIAYRDHQHLSARFALSLSNALARALALDAFPSD